MLEASVVFHQGGILNRGALLKVQIINNGTSKDSSTGNYDVRYIEYEVDSDGDPLQTLPEVVHRGQASVIGYDRSMPVPHLMYRVFDAIIHSDRRYAEVELGAGMAAESAG